MAAQHTLTHSISFYCSSLEREWLDCFTAFTLRSVQISSRKIGFAEIFVSTPRCRLNFSLDKKKQNDSWHQKVDLIDAVTRLHVPIAELCTSMEHDEIVIDRWRMSCRFADVYNSNWHAVNLRGVLFHYAAYDNLNAARSIFAQKIDKKNRINSMKWVALRHSLSHDRTG